MEAFLIILSFFIYIILYTFASFLFNYKIYLISNDKFYLSALASGVAIFINISLFAFIPFFAVTLTNWWIIFPLIFALTIGSFISNAILGKVDLFHQKKDQNKNLKKIQEEYEHFEVGE